MSVGQARIYFLQSWLSGKTPAQAGLPEAPELLAQRFDELKRYAFLDENVVETVRMVKLSTGIKKGKANCTKAEAKQLLQAEMGIRLRWAATLTAKGNFQATRDRHKSRART